MLLRAFLGVVVVLCVVNPIVSEVRFVCPRPISIDSTISTHPCGHATGFDEDNYIEVSPGGLTVKYEETDWRGSMPSKISLFRWDTLDRACVLLDDIPHNDLAPDATPYGDCHYDDFPLGGCSNGTGFVTIHIPDISCDECFLQLVQVVMPAGASTCRESVVGDSTCETFYSCANIRIRPEHGAALTTESCALDYETRTPGYRQARHSDPLFEGAVPQDLFPGGHFWCFWSARATIECSLSLPEAGVFPGWPILTNVRIETLSGTSIKALSPGQRGFTGPLLPFAAARFERNLKDEEIVVVISHSPVRPVNPPTFPVTEIVLKRAGGVYSSYGRDWTESGWLSGDLYSGIGAVNPWPVMPIGCCVDDVQTYMVLIEEDGEVVALITFSVIPPYLYIVGIVVPGYGNAVVSICSADETVTEALPAGVLTFGVLIHGVLDISAFLAAAGGPPSVIKLSLPIDTISKATAIKAIKAVFINDDDEILGVAAITMEEPSTFNIYAMIESGEPQFQLEHISGASTNLGGDIWFFSEQGFAPIITMKLLTSALVIDETVSGLQAQFDKMNLGMCEGMSHVGCFYKIGYEPETSDQLAMPVKIIVTFFMSATNELFMKITVQELKSTQTITLLQILDFNGNVLLFGGGFTDSPDVAKSQIASVSVLITGADLNSLYAGELVCVLTLDDAGNDIEITSGIPIPPGAADVATTPAPVGIVCMFNIARQQLDPDACPHKPMFRKWIGDECYWSTECLSPLRECRDNPDLWRHRCMTVWENVDEAQVQGRIGVGCECRFTKRRERRAQRYVFTIGSTDDPSAPNIPETVDGTEDWPVPMYRHKVFHRRQRVDVFLPGITDTTWIRWDYIGSGAEPQIKQKIVRGELTIRINDVEIGEHRWVMLMEDHSCPAPCLYVFLVTLVRLE